MKIKFKRDFYNPLNRKIILKGSNLELEVDKDKTPLNQFWRGIIKDNKLTDIVEIINNKKNK
jgi:hypothetical protein